MNGRTTPPVGRGSSGADIIHELGLVPGMRVGANEVTAPLGADGMGEVYQGGLPSSPTVFRTPSDRLGHAAAAVRAHNRRQVVKTLNESAVSHFSRRSARGLHRRGAVRWGDWMDGPLSH